MVASCAIFALGAGLCLLGQSGGPAPGAAPQVSPGTPASRPQDTQPSTRPLGRNAPAPDTIPGPGGDPLVSPGTPTGRPIPPTRPPFSRNEPGADTGPPTRDLPPLRHPRDRTLLVEIHYAKPEILAKSLQKTYGETMTIELAAGSSVPAILVSGTEKNVQEAKELLEKLDKPGRSATLEFTVVESDSAESITAAMEEGAKRKPLTDEMWDKLLKDLKKNGKISAIRMLEVKAVENQPARVQVGEDKPLAMGSTIRATGIASVNYSFRPVGTLATVTLRQGKDSEYRLDLMIQDSRIQQASPTASASKDKEKNPEVFKPDSVLTFTAEASVQLKTGVPVRINSNQEWDKAGSRQVLVYVRLKNS